MDVAYSNKQVKMELCEENLFKNENYELLCQCVDKEIDETHPTWRIDFVIVDSSNGNTMIGTEDMCRIFNVYKDNDSASASESSSSFNIMFRLQSLYGANESKKRDMYDAKTEYENLEKIQDCWDDSNRLQWCIINCDKELDFICGNLTNICQCEKILIEECKENLSNNEQEKIINKENKSAMEKRFNHLLKSMEMEGHYRGSSVYDSICDAKRNALQLRWQEALTQTKNVLNEIKPFDIKKMLTLYDKTLEAAEEAKGKDLCLLLGHTGTVLCFCF